MKLKMMLVMLVLLSHTLHAVADPMGDCIAALANDDALQPIADKVALSGDSDRAFFMMANNSHPTASEKVVILDWGNKRERCLSNNPPPQNPVTHILVEGFRTVQSMILDLYNGDVSYGEFNRRRQDLNNAQQAMLQQVINQYQQQQFQQRQYQQQREDYLDQACLNRARNQIEMASCGMGRAGRQLGEALLNR